MINPQAKLSAEEVRQLGREFDSKSALEILRWTLDRYHPQIALASSFGAEDVVVIDLMAKVVEKPRVFTLDTGRLHQETYDVMEWIRERYRIPIEVYFPNSGAVENMVREHGLNLFYHSIEARKMCCGIRKVEPLGRALGSLRGWITGLRREQSVTRGDVAAVEFDADHGGIVKVNPIIRWTRDEVWDHIKSNKIPYNALHDRGYPSIGCAPCTRAVQPGEDERAGRWWWERPDLKECGLHVKAKPAKS
ncbi:MAG: phosphoadenylyl-sulfate reductase [Nitrospirae bacterium]|nr:phosphoadenylyl-sulfate reductase [Nitrospirota bacterium]